MRIHGYLVEWSRLLGFADCGIGLGLLIFPSTTLGLMGLDQFAFSMPLVRIIGAMVFGMGNLYFFGLLESRRDESYEPLRQFWLVTACFRFCAALFVGGLILWKGAKLEAMAFPLSSAIVGGWELSVILLGKFPDCK